MRISCLFFMKYKTAETLSVRACYPRVLLSHRAYRDSVYESLESDVLPNENSAINA